MGFLTFYTFITVSTIDFVLFSTVSVLKSDDQGYTVDELRHHNDFIGATFWQTFSFSPFIVSHYLTGFHCLTIQYEYQFDSSKAQFFKETGLHVIFPIENVLWDDLGQK